MSYSRRLAKLNSVEILTTELAGYETGYGSLENCRAVAKEIKKHIPATSLTICSCLADLERLVNRRPDLVVLAAKFLPLDSGKLFFSDYLDRQQLLYTGSNNNALVFDSSKSEAKHLAKKLGIATPKFVKETHFLRACPRRAVNLGFPLFLKPDGMENSFGINADSVVTDEKSYVQQVNYLLANYRGDVLAEKHLPGREFTVGVVQSSGLRLEAYLAEIVAHQNAPVGCVLTRNVKAANREQILPVRESKIHRILSFNSKRLFREMGATGIAMFDFKMDHKDRCHFLEVNMVPGMNPKKSYMPKVCKLDGNIGYKDLVQALILSSLSDITNTDPLIIA